MLIFGGTVLVWNVLQMAHSKDPGEFYDCSVCNTFTTCKRDAEAHLRGRYHQSMLAKLEAAQRSVYVRGFPKGTDKKDLENVFEQFGSVKIVAMEHQGNFAIVEFAEVDAVLKTLRHTEELVLSGKKLAVRERKVGAGKRPKRQKKKKKGSAAAEKDGKGEAEEEEKEEGEGDREKMEVETGDPIPSKIGGVHFDKDTIDSLQAAQSMAEEMEILASHCRIQTEAVKTQLSISLSLSRQLDPLFPGCLVVAFGAPISGHGTVTSDCDLSLIIDPTAQDKKILEEKTYYSSAHMEMWKGLLYSGQLQDPETPLEKIREVSPSLSSSEHDASVSGESNTSLTSTGSTPRAVSVVKQKSSSSSLQFDMLLPFLRSKAEYSRIIPIKYARCPIIRFIHLPTSLHCDLSINNRLGPINTLLMRAYFEFDPRMSLLIPVVRLWARSLMKHPPLNSYAISLLLIFSLQHTSPPVLPCLQDPGPWPRNMEWFAEKGLALAAKEGMVGSSSTHRVDGWECGFTHPQSLKPSANTATPVELLAHFFKFYSELFSLSKHVVAIHSRSWLTLQQANQLLRESASDGSHAHLSLHTSSPLCIQDPFDLGHNITKSIRKYGYSTLCEIFKIGSAIFDRQLHQLGSSDDDGGHCGSLLTIFDEKRYYNVLNELSSLGSKYIDFTSENIQELLAKEAELQVLASGLHDLDLTNESVVTKLGTLVVGKLVKILRDGLGFACTEESGVSALSLDGEDVATSAAMACDPQQQVEKTSPAEVAIEKEESSRKRSRSEEDNLDDSQDSIADNDDEDRPKRSRVGMTSSQPMALDVLSSAVAGVDPSSRWHCSAPTKSWVRRRRARRQAAKEGEATPVASGRGEGGGGGGGGDGQSLVASLPDVPPVLEFYLSLRVHCDSQGEDQSLLSIELTPSHARYATEFMQFVAFFRKHLRSAAV